MDRGAGNPRNTGPIVDLLTGEHSSGKRQQALPLQRDLANRNGKGMRIDADGDQ
ncbi:hypothetical protein X743_03525 [Mesorhizobium sp. LNHC252B00]|nr:hypothetical protein X743_03525 [Mesorhizobium sp. LNHC252B00]